MKKSIKIIGALAVILSVTFACKKSNDDVRVDQKNQKFSVDMKVASFEGESENAILVGTNAELEAALNGKQEITYIKRATEKNNLFIPVTGTVTPVDPVNPMELCWDEINNYYANHIEGWQNTANQTCKPVMICITCPKSGGGLYVLYVIKPTSPKCNISEAVSVMYDFNKFGFNVKDYESESVSAYIHGKR